VSSEREHPREELQGLLDGRLVGEAREAIERHLATCGQCRGELAGLRWAKEQVARLATVPVPADLAERVCVSLDAEDARVGRRSRLPPWTPVAAAAMLVLALLVIPLWRPTGPDVVGEVRADVVGVVEGALALEAGPMPPPELEAWFAQRGIPFATRVFDLGGMAFELVGGRVERTAGGPGALFVYRGPEGRLVVCQMFRGEVPRPDDAAVHYRDDGVEFLTVLRDGIVLVFWREGDVTCVMGSTDLPAEEIRALAYAKAVKI